MIESYFIPTADLLVNILILKAELEKKRIAKVATNLSEITTMCDYTSAKTGNQVVFENSYTKILATTQRYSHQFILNNETGEISLSPKYYNKNTKKLKRVYSIAPEIRKHFREYLEKKINRETIKELLNPEHIKNLHSEEDEKRRKNNARLNALTPEQLKTLYQ